MIENIECLKIKMMRKTGYTDGFFNWTSYQLFPREGDELEEWNCVAQQLWAQTLELT